MNVVGHELKSQYLYMHDPAGTGSQHIHTLVKLFIRTKNILHFRSVSVQMPKWTSLSECIVANLFFLRKRHRIKISFHIHIK